MGEQQPFIFHTVKAKATIFSLSSRFDHLGEWFFFVVVVFKSGFLNLEEIVLIRGSTGWGEGVFRLPRLLNSSQICDSLVQREVSLPDMF